MFVAEKSATTFGDLPDWLGDLRHRVRGPIYNDQQVGEIDVEWAHLSTYSEQHLTG